MKIKRKIIRIDEEKCNGCGLCVPACAEGAIGIIDGKARLVAEKYCDGLGACLGECPQDALTIIEADVEAFDMEAAEAHVKASETGPAAVSTGHAVRVPVHADTGLSFGKRLRKSRAAGRSGSS